MTACEILEAMTINTRGLLIQRRSERFAEDTWRSLGIDPGVPESGHGVFGACREVLEIWAEMQRQDLRALGPTLLEGQHGHALVIKTISKKSYTMK